MRKRYKKRKNNFDKREGLENFQSRMDAKVHAKTLSLEDRAKATGKTIAQLVVESWEDNE